jgi:hypothetical protein
MLKVLKITNHQENANQKTTLRYHFTPVRTAVTNKQTKIKRKQMLARG